jgi:hypothetical protein
MQRLNGSLDILKVHTTNLAYIKQITFFLLVKNLLQLEQKNEKVSLELEQSTHQKKNLTHKLTHMCETRYMMKLVSS